MKAVLSALVLVMVTAVWLLPTKAAPPGPAIHAGLAQPRPCPPENPSVENNTGSNGNIFASGNGCGALSVWELAAGGTVYFCGPGARGHTCNADGTCPTFPPGSHESCVGCLPTKVEVCINGNCVVAWDCTDGSAFTAPAGFLPVEEAFANEASLQFGRFVITEELAEQWARMCQFDPLTGRQSGPRPHIFNTVEIDEVGAPHVVTRVASEPTRAYLNLDGAIIAVTSSGSASQTQ